MTGAWVEGCFLQGLVPRLQAAEGLSRSPVPKRQVPAQSLCGQQQLRGWWCTVGWRAAAECLRQASSSSRKWCCRMSPSSLWHPRHPFLLLLQTLLLLAPCELQLVAPPAKVAQPHTAPCLSFPVLSCSMLSCPNPCCAVLPPRPRLSVSVLQPSVQCCTPMTAHQRARSCASSSSTSSCQHLCRWGNSNGVGFEGWGSRAHRTQSLALLASKGGRHPQDLASTAGLLPDVGCSQQWRVLQQCQSFGVPRGGRGVGQIGQEGQRQEGRGLNAVRQRPLAAACEPPLSWPAAAAGALILILLLLLLSCIITLAHTLSLTHTHRM